MKALLLTPALFMLAALATSCDTTSSRQPDIILVVIDTARADRFTPNASTQPATPSFRKLASEGLLFEHAYSTSSWTVPSHASLFTGLFPITHQATQETQHLSGKFETLAEILSEAGYETAAFSNNPWVSDQSNLMQGFAESHEMWSKPKQLSASGLPHPTNERVFRWMSSRTGGRPFFLFVNYMEPHWPYTAPPDYSTASISVKTRGEARGHPGNFPVADWYMNRRSMPEEAASARRELYTAEIAYSDAILGELRAGLERLAVWEESLVVVTADHGENLGENGHQGHIFALYGSTVRVPLVIRSPGTAPAAGVRRDPVQVTDLFTTILAAAGSKADDPRIDGIDLLSRRAPDDRPVLAEYYYPLQAMAAFPKTAEAEKDLAPFRRRVRSLQIGKDKLIWGSDGRHELYDVKLDPAESMNLIAANPRSSQALLTRLDAILSRLGSEPPPPPDQQPMDEETEETLRSLGYIR